MSTSLVRLQTRLRRIERIFTDLPKPEKPVNCNCRDLTAAHDENPDEFESEMNRKCPVHGFRQLGSIIRVKYVERGRHVGIGQVTTESAKLDHLLNTYWARRSSRGLRVSQLRQVGL